MSEKITAVVTDYSKTSEDYVAGVEARLARETADVNWHIGLWKRCEVALETIKQESALDWQDAEKMMARVWKVQDRLVDLDLCPDLGSK